MSVIQPQPRIERQTVTMKLEVLLVCVWKLYAEFIQSSQEWVANESFRFTFTTDDEFLQWLRLHHADVADALLRSVHALSRRRIGRNASASAASSPTSKSME